MGGGVEFIFIVLMMLGQAGQDMLDFVSTDAYWAQKNVKVTVEQLRQDAGPDAKVESIEKELKVLENPEFAVRDAARKKILAMGPGVIENLKPAMESKDEEVALAAKGIVDELTTHAQARSIRRLMAIRTLGEKKDKDSLPLLRQMATSKEPFVADYANRAMGLIEGKAWKRAVDDTGLAADLAALPKNTGMVGQVRTLVGTKTLRLDDLLATMGEGGPGGEGMAERKAEIAKTLPKMKLKMTKGVVDFAEKLGNVRLDSLTVAASEDVGENKGWAAFSLRGQMSIANLLTVLESMDESMKGKVEEVEGMKVLRVERSMVLLLVSEQHVIFVGGPDEENVDAGVKAIAKGIKTGKGEDGGLAANEKTQALLKGVDTQAAIWAVGRLSDDMKKEDVFGAYDDFQLTTKVEKGTIQYTVKATGPDAEKIKDAMTKMNEEMARGVKQMEEMMPKATVDMMKSVKIVAEGKTATLSGFVSMEGLVGTMSQMIGMFMYIGGDEMPGAVEGVGPDMERAAEN